MSAYKGRIITFNQSGNLKVINGYLIVKNGVIKNITKEKPYESVEDYGDYLILPGFVDGHIHLPQLKVRAKWSEDLMSWLEKYVFPEEIRLLDEQYAHKVSREFFRELARNGTTSAMVYGPPSAESTEVAFQAAKESGLRVVMGQTLMDINVPDELQTAPNKAIKYIKEISKRWNDERLKYALTLRFAPTCSMKLMQKTALVARAMGLPIQTHISEQKSEVETVKKMFGMTYAQVYDMAGVLYEKTVLAHAIHLTDAELALLARRRVSIVHCPSSNFFLHSGVMNLKRIEKYDISVSFGSDVAAGLFINMLPVLRNAYYANSMSPEKAFYMLTLGGARVLGLESMIGTLERGKQADFVILDAGENSSVSEALSYLMFLGDDRNVIATYVNGTEVWSSRHHP